MPYAGVSIVLPPVVIFLTEIPTLLHGHFNPRVFTAAEPTLSPLASPGLLYSKSQLLSLTPPTPQLSVPSGRFLYFIKFGCQLEIQPYHPLSHILCMLTMRKHSPEGPTSVMLVSNQSQKSRLSSLWDLKHTSRPPRFSDIQPQTKCLCWFPGPGPFGIGLSLTTSIPESSVYL